MPIHASSVISTQIQQFDPLLYTALTDQENYCYTTLNANIVAGQEVTTYQPEFQLLNDEMVLYLGISRTIMPDLVMSFFGYNMMHFMYGTDYSQLPNLPISSLFNMNGEATAIKAGPVSYFAESSVLVTPGNTFAVVKLPASTLAISAADAAEQSSLNAVNSSMSSVVKAQSSLLIFDDIAPIGGPPPKRDTGNLIFGSAAGQFGYKKYNTILNLGLTIPSYII